MSIKVQIKNELHKNSWDIILKDSLNEWWEDEHWLIQWKHSQGLKIYIQFLIDSQTNDVWLVKAVNGLEANVPEIASFSIGRKFQTKLKEFVIEIEKYRKVSNKQFR